MKIKFCQELPQWITSSDIGAYHPYARTIYVRKNLGLSKTIFVLCHELLHYFVHVTKLPNKLHSVIDKTGGGQVWVIDGQEYRFRVAVTKAEAERAVREGSNIVLKRAVVPENSYIKPWTGRE